MASCVIQFLIVFERRVVYLTIIARAFESIQANQPLVYNNKRTLRYHANPSSFHQCWSDYDNNNYSNNNNNNNYWDIPQTDFAEATASGFACVNTRIIIICKCDFEAVINKWLEGIASRANGPLTLRQVSCTQNMNWVCFNSSVFTRQWVLSNFPFSLFWHFCSKKDVVWSAGEYNIEH